MKLQWIIHIAFLFLPLISLYFAISLSQDIRFGSHSIIFLGIHWTCWSHVYVVFSMLFCLFLYFLSIFAIFRKSLKPLLLILGLILLFAAGSVALAVVLRNI